MQYKLLTPGPLTTTDTVKQEMMVDHCTWDDDYKQVTQKIRSGLLELAGVSLEEYTTVLMQGSGTFGVEAGRTIIFWSLRMVLMAREWQTLPDMPVSIIRCISGRSISSRMPLQ